MQIILKELNKKFDEMTGDSFGKATDGKREVAHLPSHNRINGRQCWGQIAIAKVMHGKNASKQTC